MTVTITRPASGLGTDKAREIGAEAYTYLFPLVMMDATRRQMTNAEAGQRPGFGPMNGFTHMRAFPPPEFKTVPWANADTLYSLGWLDVSTEPQILSVPNAGGRYLLLPVQDMWTDVVAVPGKRTSGSGADSFALVGPGWHGELPSGVQRIDAPTPVVWVMGRTQTNGPDDYEAVRQIQDGYTVTPLSRWGQPPQPVRVTVDPGVDMATPPVEQVTALEAADFFAGAAELLKVHPPHVTDWSVLQRIRRIGLQPGRSFDMGALDPAVRQGLEEAPAAALAVMRAKVPHLAPSVNGWQMNTETIGVYGNAYLKRATLALMGLGSNPPEDAIYPLTFVDADGRPLTGEHTYVLHFDGGALPPAAAFWSVTLYDTDGFKVPNPLGRLALGDRDPLHYNADGSLDLVIQHEHPGADREPNWLPGPPSGPLALFLRLYEPKPEALDGRWAPPAARRTR
jgi:hypothetical protein